MNKLQEIIEQKKIEVAKIKHLEDKLKYTALQRNDFRSLARALCLPDERLSLIAEVKKASPSVGVITESFDPVNQARLYAQAGASAISVLTDEKFFQGRLDYLTKIRQAVDIPCLRKDFIIDEVQICEAVVAGADAILLIVAALEQDRLIQLMNCAHDLQLDVLVEVHDREELERALDTDVRILGINNRNLKTFVVDIHTTEELSQEVPDDILLVSESGLKTYQDARDVYDWGANAILVGETLMRADDIDTAVTELMTMAPVSAEKS
jgi:indole-3-glycerol phosphate synthase